MRAISQEILGGPEVLHEVELPIPEPEVGQVLIAVRAAGLNGSDWKHRAVPVYLGAPPFVLGWDVSGVVERIGSGVTLFEPGDEVFGMLPYPHGAGSHAEYVVGPARAFVLKPATVDHDQAAAVPLAALTAYQALVDTAGLGPGQRVLIHGAAGGVGHLAVQIARARGARITGTSSPGKHGFLRELGVDHPIDYHGDDVANLDGAFDVVLDAVGGYGPISLPLLRAGGIFVSIRPGGVDGLAEEAEARGVRTATLVVEHDHAGMRVIADLLESGGLRPTIAARFPLARAAEAHRQGEIGRTSGKIIITVP